MSSLRQWTLYELSQMMSHQNRCKLPQTTSVRYWPTSGSLVRRSQFFSSWAATMIRDPREWQLSSGCNKFNKHCEGCPLHEGEMGCEGRFRRVFPSRYWRHQSPLPRPGGLPSPLARQPAARKARKEANTRGGRKPIRRVPLCTVVAVVGRTHALELSLRIGLQVGFIYR